MPKGTKVHSCVQKVMKQGKAKPNAIRICQASTGLSYQTGKKPKNNPTSKDIQNYVRRHGKKRTR